MHPGATVQATWALAGRDAGVDPSVQIVRVGDRGRRGHRHDIGSHWHVISHGLIHVILRVGGMHVVRGGPLGFHRGERIGLGGVRDSDAGEDD